MGSLIKIQHDGKPWHVASIGARREGKAYCHLVSTTLGKWQRNGFYPIQMADWIAESVIEAAQVRP